MGQGEPTADPPRGPGPELGAAAARLRACRVSERAPGAAALCFSARARCGRPAPGTPPVRVGLDVAGASERSDAPATSRPAKTSGEAGRHTVLGRGGRLADRTGSPCSPPPYAAGARRPPAVHRPPPAAPPAAVTAASSAGALLSPPAAGHSVRPPRAGERTGPAGAGRTSVRTTRCARGRSGSG